MHHANDSADDDVRNVGRAKAVPVVHPTQRRSFPGVTGRVVGVRRVSCFVTIEPEVPQVVADVYWRPGCPYCSALRRDLSRRSVPTRWHDIWQDAGARDFVRSKNHGNETVPTVRVGDVTLTNPRGAQVAQMVGSDGDSSALDQSASSRRRALSWVPTIVLVGASLTADVTGHTSLSWLLDISAIASWWLTRPLRR